MELDMANITGENTLSLRILIGCFNSRKENSVGKTPTFTFIVEDGINDIRIMVLSPSLFIVENIQRFSKEKEVPQSLI